MIEIEQEVIEWRQERLDRLSQDDGWLTLVGLAWLEEGENSLGSDPASDVVLPESLPSSVGILRLNEGRVSLTTNRVEVTVDGELRQQVDLVSDGQGDPTVVELGSVTFYVIERQGRQGVRIKDRESSTFKDFQGLSYYPTSADWRVSGRFIPYDPPKILLVPNVLGTPNEQPSPGVVEFVSNENTYRIDALDGGDGELFLVFGDETNGAQTYGGGRFLYTAPPSADGTVTVDFNQAYNPPCVFTPYATCPLPPPQNKLALAIPAGEKSYAGGYH